MSKNSHFYFFLLSLVLFNWSFSQEKIPLKKILFAIEKQHKVKFNYIDDVVAKFRLVPPESSLLLSQKLNYLTSETQLEFENINPTYISVAEKKAKGNI